MARTYAISIKQPWAALVVAGIKTIEVRSWLTHWRGRILIHAARVPDDRSEGWAHVTDDIRPLTKLGGGVIGEAILTECRHYADLAQFTQDSKLHLNAPGWFQTKRLYGFVLGSVKQKPFQRWPGNVRLFTVEEST